MYKNSREWNIAELDYLERNKKSSISQLTIALTRSKSAIQRKIKELESGAVNPSQPKKNKVSYIGKRPDCDNLFFRSAWESNFYRYLKQFKDFHLELFPNKQLLKIEYEPVTFSFAPFGILKGTVSYTPDFLLHFQDGTSLFCEVKGMLKKQDMTRIRRFKKYYPKEFAKLTAVVGSSKVKAANFFRTMGCYYIWYYNDIKKEWKHNLKGWEGS